jgi:hypothetical protein
MARRRGSKTAGATSASLPRMSRPGIYGNCRRHLVLVICGEPHLVVGDIPGLDADHAAPGGVAEIDHGGCLCGPGLPHHARRGGDFFDDDAAAPPAIFNGALPRRIEVDPVGFCRDSNERRGLRLAPRRFGLVDGGGAGEPGDRDGADIGDREVGVQRLLEDDRMAPSSWPRAGLVGAGLVG